MLADDVVEVSLQKRDAPAAARPRAAAFTDLRGDAGLVDADEVHDLPFGDVKAEANFVVEFHEDFRYGPEGGGSETMRTPFFPRPALQIRFLQINVSRAAK